MVCEQKRAPLFEVLCAEGENERKYVKFLSSQ